MTEVPTVPVGTLVDRYVKLRDRIKQVDDLHKEKTKAAREMLEQINAQLLDALNQSGSNSIATDAGTAYRIERASASIEDHTNFKTFVIANEEWDMIDWKANKTAVEDYLKEFDALPPGVKYSSAFVAGVRRSGDK